MDEKWVCWTINGVPACQAAETLDPRLSPQVRCPHPSRAECWTKDASRLQALYPEVDIEILDGACPGCLRNLAAGHDGIAATAGGVYSPEDRLLATLVWRRFGFDAEAAAAAWQRLIQNTGVTAEQFMEMLRIGTDD